ncbi:OmpL47-type beta-barrel domain-containing protein [Candidatus Aenigmatarchaeota archaeon]
MKKGHMGIIKVSTFIIFLALFLLSFTFYIAPAFSIDEAEVWVSDEFGNPKTGFAPGETAYIHGLGYDTISDVGIEVTEPGQGQQFGSDTTDEEGDFFDGYAIQLTEEGEYDIIASDLTHTDDITILSEECVGPECPDATCGDGIIDYQSEECDDGNTEGGDGCDSICMVEDGWFCYFQPSICSLYNPEIPASCGVDMALILDSSGSISSTELAEMKDAFKDFVNAFLPNTPTEIAVIEFDSTATLVQDYTNDITLLENAIDSVTSGGMTNWEDGLEVTHDQFDNRIGKPDLYVFSSDGGPNRYGNPEVSCGSLECVWEAVQDSNEAKSYGVKILSLGIGVGDTIAAQKMKMIAEEDDYYDTDFNQLAEDLADLAEELCGGTVTVRKFVDDVPAEDWFFSASVSGGYAVPENGLTDESGFIVFEIQINDTTAYVDITETLQGDYSFVSAVCYNGNQTVGDPAGLSVVSIPVGQVDSIYCEFHNTEITEYCGDGEINGDEECDGENLGGMICEDVGEFNYGDLSCYPPGHDLECTFDTEDCELDLICPNVEVISPPDSNPVTWYRSPVLSQATISDYQSGVREGRIIFHDQEVTWSDGFFIMEYNASTGFYEYTWTPEEEDLCSYVLVDVYGEDWAGNGANNECGDTNQFGIDNEPPNTTKTWTDPYIMCETGDPFDCDLFVTSDTEFMLSAVENCGAGVNSTYYRINGGDWIVYENSFQLQPGCGQTIEYYSIDNVGNEEVYQTEIDNVDDTPPITEKTFEGMTYGPDNYYLLTNTNIILTATDYTEDCPVGVNYIHYEVYWKMYEEDDWQLVEENDVYDNVAIINFDEESFHMLKWYAVDLLGNMEEEHVQYHAVDETPPETTKTVGQPHIQIGYNIYFITQDTPITLECVDPEPHPAGDVSIYYRYNINGGEYTDWTEYEAPFTFDEDCEHRMEYYCVDALGNEEEVQFEIDWVDTVGPNIYKDLTGLYFECGGEDCHYYVNSDTEIVLTAEDPEPHPAGENYIEYRIFWKLNEGDEWELIQDWTLYEGPISYEEDSYHRLEYRAYDLLGNMGPLYEEIDAVDLLPPITTKVVGDPNLECDYFGDQEEAEQCKFIRTITPIDFSCEDQDPHPVNDVSIFFRQRWRYDLSTSWEDWSEWNEVEGTVYLSEDSIHELEFYCVDALGNEEEHRYEIDIVDDLAPESVSEAYGPQYYDEELGKLYIDGVTEIEITCEDPEPHPVGVDEIWYRYFVDGELIEDWMIYEGMFGFPEESMHELEYYCVDLLGNVENENIDVYYVDHTPPVTEIDFGYPYYPEEEMKWISIETPIYLSADDGDEVHSSGVHEVIRRVTIVDDSHCSNYDACENAEGEGSWVAVLDDEVEFQIGEESCHLIEYYSVDNVEKTEEVNKDCVFVDDTAPTVEKDVGEPRITSEMDEHLVPDEYEIKDDAWYITQDTEITLECEDIEQPHPVGTVYTYYKYYNDGDLIQDWTEYETSFTYGEDTYHELYYYCIDEVDNMGPIHYELDIVDSQAPELWKDVGYPRYECEREECDYYVTQETPITFYCEDMDPHPVDDVTIEYRMRWKENFEDEWDLWSDWTIVNSEEETIYFGEDSVHEIEYKCYDALGNEAGVYSEIDVVDSQVPEVTKEIGEPNVVCEGAECDYYVTQNTEIELTCTDPEPHPVDDVTIEYRMRWKYDFGDEWGEWSDWYTYGELIVFNEDSLHEIEYKCYDALGNEAETESEIDAVDTDAPESWKVLGEPKRECTQQEKEMYGDDCWYLTQNTLVELYCEDVQPHPVNDVSIYYTIDWKETWDDDWETIIEGDAGDYTSFTYEDDSFHRLTWYCMDALDNAEKPHVEIDIVDTQAPVTEKTVGEPKYSCEGPDCDWWITQETEISFTCEDLDPHPVDNVEIYYRYNVDESGWTEWIMYTNPFTFPEDSMHELEYYCIDELQNMEPVQYELDHVDTEGPVIEKWVEGGPYAKAYEEIEVCADIHDIKQTQDPGVGVNPETPLTILTNNGDTDYVDMDHVEEDVYCGTWETEMCGDWHYEVEAEDYLENYNIENGINIIVDTAPACMKVLNPHAGGWYSDGKVFTVYGWTFDEGGDNECIASGVEVIEFYALDVGYEECAQEDINTSEDFIECVHNLGGDPVFLGEVTEEDITGSSYSGLLQIPEESGLTDVVYMWYVIFDKAGNGRVDFAKNPGHHPPEEEPCEAGTVITMNIDNEGPNVVITDIVGLNGPVTFDDMVTFTAAVEDYESQPESCRLDIYQYGEGPELILEGLAVANVIDYECIITGIIPKYIGSALLESGDYRFEVVAIDNENNVGSDWADFIIDNTNPYMGIVHPEEGQVYGASIPISLYLTDEYVEIADESVMFKIRELALGEGGWCIGINCEDTGWLPLENTADNLYATMIDITEYNFSGEGNYIMDAIACDDLFIPLFSDDGNVIMIDRNMVHCRQISIHGAEALERPECNDGIDNDEDEYIDYPADNGCESLEDDTEFSEPLCGDGIPEGEEECDDGEGNGELCDPEYGDSCDYCTEECTIETLEGDYCGDGMLNGPEDCDGDDLGDMTCEGLGFDFGPLFCDNECYFDTTSCAYEQTIEPIVINEFLIEPYEAYYDEWIELYNPTDETVYLSDWTIEDNTAIPFDLSSYMIDPFDYLVLTQGVDHGFQLNNEDGDTIILKKEGTDVDAVAYGEYDDGNLDDNAPEPGTDESTGRYPNGVDTDVDNVDFTVFEDPTPDEENTMPI